MWEEDPKWQQANYHFLVGAVIVGFVGSFLISLFLGEWQIFRFFLEALGVVLSALCIYAAIIWTAAHLLVRIWRAFSKLRHRHDDT